METLSDSSPLASDVLSPDHFIHQMEKFIDRYQAPLATLKLAAYATDAMRVLHVLQRHADMSKAIDDSIRTVCPDWRNPGCIDDPADLIAVALVHVVTGLRDLFSDLDVVMNEIRERSAADQAQLRL